MANTTQSWWDSVVGDNAPFLGYGAYKGIRAIPGMLGRSAGALAGAPGLAASIGAGVMMPTPANAGEPGNGMRPLTAADFPNEAAARLAAAPQSAPPMAAASPPMPSASPSPAAGGFLPPQFAQMLASAGNSGGFPGAAAGGGGGSMPSADPQDPNGTFGGKAGSGSMPSRPTPFGFLTGQPGNGDFNLGNFLKGGGDAQSALNAAPNKPFWNIARAFNGLGGGMGGGMGGGGFMPPDFQLMGR